MTFICDSEVRIYAVIGASAKDVADFVSQAGNRRGVCSPFQPVLGSRKIDFVRLQERLQETAEDSMSNLHIFGLILTCLSSATFASVQPEPNRVQVMQPYFDSLDRLTQLGVRSIGGIPTVDVRKKAESLNIVFVPVVLFPDRTGAPAFRRTAYWEPAQQTIFISQNHIAKMRAEEIGGILGHEIYRSLDIDDETLDLSAIINCFLRASQLSQTHPALYRNVRSIDVLRNQIERPRLSARTGGISGVGGGGDLRSQQIKEAIIEEIFYFYDRGAMDLRAFSLTLDLLSHFRIEISPSVQNGTYRFLPITNTILVRRRFLKSPFKRTTSR